MTNQKQTYILFEVPKLKKRFPKKLFTKLEVTADVASRHSYGTLEPSSSSRYGHTEYILRASQSYTHCGQKDT